MTGIGENGQNGRVWAKITIFFTVLEPKGEIEIFREKFVSAIFFKTQN